MPDSALLKLNAENATKAEITRAFCEEIESLSNSYDVSISLYCEPIFKIFLPNETCYPAGHFRFYGQTGNSGRKCPKYPILPTSGFSGQPFPGHERP